MHAVMKTKKRVLYATKPRLVGIVNISCIVILDTTKIDFLSKNKNIYWSRISKISNYLKFVMGEYKLSSVLEGHKLDVRCICSLPSVPDIGMKRILIGIFSWKFSQILHGIVKSISITNLLKFQGTAIVSGSRDDTARLWCESTKAIWEPSTIFKGHTRYVSSVAYRDPDETYTKVWCNKNYSKEI